MTRPTRAHRVAQTMSERGHLKVVGFDLDDTLWEVRPVIIAAEKTLSQWLIREVPGFDYDPERLRAARSDVVERQPELVGKLTELRRQVLLSVLKEHVSHDRAVSTAQAAMDVFLEARNRVELFDGAHDALRILKRRFMLGALSNGNADIHRIGLGEHFDFAFSAEDVGAPKPDSALFEAALSHSGADPHQMVYVGDDPRLDVDAANRFGLKTVWIRKSDDDEPGETEADVTIRHVRDLPDAIAKIER